MPSSPAGARQRDVYDNRLYHKTNKQVRDLNPELIINYLRDPGSSSLMSLILNSLVCDGDSSRILLGGYHETMPCVNIVLRA